MKFCCPFHADGGDEALPCAPDIPASHHDFAEMELRMLACAVLAALPPPNPRTTSMQTEFALCYGQPGTISGRFPRPPELLPFPIRAKEPHFIPSDPCKRKFCLHPRAELTETGGFVRCPDCGAETP